MIQPCPSWLWVCTCCCGQGPALGALGQKFGQGQLVPFTSTAASLRAACPSLRGCPMAGVTLCSCSISHSPPACTAARWAGSLGCVGGELLHCGSWDLARGRVLVPAAEIPTWPGVQQGELGSQGRWQEQGLKAAEQSPLCSRHQERPPRAPHQTEFC